MLYLQLVGMHSKQTPQVYGVNHLMRFEACQLRIKARWWWCWALQDRTNFLDQYDSEVDKELFFLLSQRAISLSSAVGQVVENGNPPCTIFTYSSYHKAFL